MLHYWSVVKDGQTSTSIVDVDELNRTLVRYEALAALLTQAGFTETTPIDYAAVDDDDYLHALD